MDLLLKSGHVIDPAQNLDMITDIAIDNGCIAQIGVHLNTAAAKVIDLTGKVVCPGFVDLHTHLRDPGFLYKEDLASGTQAAAAGGFTSICCMPNTDPVIDNAAVATYIREKSEKHALVNVFPIGSITKNEAGENLSAIGELVEAGCIAISDDGKPVVSSYLMRNAMNYVKIFDVPIMSHCEDLSLAKDGQVNEGLYATLTGLKGIPNACEEIIVARDIILAGLTGVRLHICHVSTAGSIQLIRRGKADGIRVTCEVTPHHLALTEAVVSDFDADSKVNPPLRTQADVDALRAALLDGTIDAIATDHAPHHLEAKECEYNQAAFGISGLETAVAVIMSELVNTGLLPLNKMVELFTSGPQRIINIERGTLKPGQVADITVIDPALEKTVNPQAFYSKGKNTPFKNKKLKGWPCLTIVNGQVVAEEGHIVKERRI